ncbi:MAG TPA: thiamine pyrophosphate-dependent enzyme [Chthoniobacterales bacterium]|nr:thiamine pyrophosphate-dependent enzyme [Chthoniobacterales bacterium]
MVTTVEPPHKARGAEILLEILRSEGAQFIFGNPGTTELPLIDALIVNRDLRYVWGLQEATAVSMADGYAQASGKPAFVNLHTSGGLGHGMGAIMNAKIARVPMVITAGQQDLRHILADPLLAADLVGMAGPVAKWCFEPNSLDDLPLILRRAFHSSMSPPRAPVFLSLPMNILDEVGSPPLLPPSRIELSSVGTGVRELASGLLRFDRCRTVIVAGNDIAEPGLGKAIARVAQLTGAPVYGASWPSVNNYPSIDPFWRGSLPTTAKGISETLGHYDCLLGLGGKSLVSIVYTMRDPIPDSIEFYHISEDANDLGYNDAPKLGIFGNVRATLEALAKELEPKVSPATVKQNIEYAQQQKDMLWRGLMERADAAIRDDEKIEPIIAAREVLRPLPDGFLLVDEAPCANLFTQPMHRSTEGRQYFHNRGGALGWGMPAAIGVSLAHDRAPVLCIVGDGSAMYSPQALWSAVHEEVPVVFVVFNNLEYGILKNFMLSQPQYNAKEHGFLAMDICRPRVDFQSLARSMGVEPTFINSYRKISEAVETALNTGKPHLIEIPVTGVAVPPV